MIIKPIKRAVRSYIRPKSRYLYRLNSALGRFEDPVWLIGSARSGTTWFSSLINYHGRFREMFEPFHPEEAGERASFLIPFQYVRPGSDHEKLEGLASDIFSGTFSHERADRGSLRLIYNGLVIKDIYANLFAAWACRKFGIRKTVLLIRNPFSVALSKTKHQTWFNSTDTLEFLNQDQLMADHLKPFQDLIRDVKKMDDFLINQILIWSVIHYVPFRQFEAGQLHVVFYEDLYRNPTRQLQETYAHLFPDTPKQKINPDERILLSPSRYSSKRQEQLTTENLLHRWKNDLSRSQLQKGMEILKAFGLHKIYGNGSIPDRSALNSLLSGTRPGK